VIGKAKLFLVGEERKGRNRFTKCWLPQRRLPNHGCQHNRLKEAVITLQVKFGKKKEALGKNVAEEKDNAENGKGMSFEGGAAKRMLGRCNAETSGHS